ncbi:MAG: hypothetical protein F9K49_09075, partial [Caedimonadaceae bacterium]
MLEPMVAASSGLIRRWSFWNDLIKERRPLERTVLKKFAALFLLSFIASSSVEGRVHFRPHPQFSSLKKATTRNLTPTRNLSSQRKKQVVAQKRPQRPLIAKRPQARGTLISKGPLPPKVAATQKTPLKASPINKRQVISKKIPSRTIVRAQPQAKKTNLQRKKPSPIASNIRTRKAISPNFQHQYQQKTSLTQKKRPSQPTFKGSSRRQALLAKRTFTNQTSVNRKTPQKTDYLSLLPFHNQQNAKAGGLNKLLGQGLNGQGQTVAVIELSGEWKALKEAINGKNSPLSPQLKSNYKANFLTPIGGPGLH